MDKQKLLAELLKQAKELPHRDPSSLDALLRKSEMIIRNIFGETSKYLNDLRRINFFPSVYPADASHFNERWASGVNELENLLQTMSEELTLFSPSPADAQNQKREVQKNPKTRQSAKGRVFVVHGRDDSLKNEVARFLERLELEVIILHERANKGKTIIEKFEDESAKVDFAVVLLTADDEGSIKGGAEGLVPRARQNVIFELGYFIGRCGRAKVAALKDNSIEVPSDYSGVMYIELNNTQAWMLQLANEIKHSGLDIDLNQAV